MSKINFKNIKNIIKLNLKTNKSSIIGWSISMFLIMFLYMILFSSMKDIALAKLEVMPKEMLKLFSMDSITDMNNYIKYFGMIFNIMLIVISIYSATFSAKLIYKEENTKSIEFLNSLNVNRSEIYISKLITAFISVTLVLFSTMLAALISGLINGGDTFVIYDFIKIIKMSSISVYFFMSISFLISGITAKINPSSISSIFVLVTYMIGYLGVLLEKKFITYFSPFESFNTKAVLSNSNTTILLFVIYFTLIIIFILIGHKFYRNRDFVI